ncbi:MAG: hypothetical protein KDA89_09000, partial [Planctomycetaceae bacterium]|nr:hypothetical protein [Planctomycetaceae bacterium]
SRIEALRGSANLIAEGTPENPVIFTSLLDDRYGAGGTFDTTGNGTTTEAAPGDWSGLIFNMVSSGSIDNAVIAFAGGESLIAGGPARFNTVEAHHYADLRIANSVFEFNDDGNDAGNRDARGTNEAATIFLRQVQPVIVNNVFTNNTGAIININVNAMTADVVRDPGRSTGALDVGVPSGRQSLDPANEFADNYGPLIRLNRFADNDINGMVVRGGQLSTESVWDDTDIVHVVFDEIIVDQHHTYSGLTLQSSTTESLVVKLSGTNAGFTADGVPLDIDDRIGGTVQILGRPEFPVVMTSLDDSTIGAGFRPDGFPQNFTIPGIQITPNPGGTSAPYADIVLIVDESASLGPLQAFTRQLVPALDSQLMAGGVGNNPLVGGNQFGLVGFGGFPADPHSIPVGAGGQLMGTAAEYVTAATNLVVNGAQEDGWWGIDYALQNYTLRPAAEKFYILVTNEGHQTLNSSLQLSGVLAGLTQANVTLHGILDVNITDSLNQQAVAADGFGGTAFLPDGSGGFTLGSGANITTFNLPFQPTIPDYTDLVFGTGGIVGDVQIVGQGGNSTDSFSDALISTIVSQASGGNVTNAGAGDWRSVRFNEYANDRNVRTILEEEAANNQGIEENNDPDSNSQFLGELAKDLKSGDDNRPLGFEVHGFISADDPGDVDVYSFQVDAGTEVWIDLDRTRSASLDAQVELIQQDGAILAASAGANQASDLSGLAQPLEKNTYDGGDFYTLNYQDPGMRVVLPGVSGGDNETYYIRVSSRNGQTSGQYRMQLRLQQTDEKPGSIVQYADIRFATNGIEVYGLPAHSPLLSESSEITGDNNGLNGAQDLGNQLQVDRNTLSVGGGLSNATDVDFYRFTSDYATTIYGESIQAIGAVNEGEKTWSTVFDVDYADGLTRADSTLIVYQTNSNGNTIPVLIGRESNVTDDQPGAGQGIDLDDLTRGSAGQLDPFIGPVQLPTGTPGSTHEYFFSVNSNQRLLTQLNQTYVSGANNADLRLEPVNSVTRIVEDHIGFQGYDSNERQIDPIQTNGLFDISNPTTLSTFVRDFDLADVPLFVSYDNRLLTFNALYGNDPSSALSSHQNGLTTDFGPMDANSGDFQIRDIVMRSDGTLWGYQRINSPNATNNNNTAGRLVQIDPGTGARTVIGTDNIPGGINTVDASGTANTDPRFADITFTDDVEALAWERSGGVNQDAQYALYYAVREDGRDGTGTSTVNTKLYRANPDSGSAATNINSQYGIRGDLQAGDVSFASSNITVSDGNGGPATVRVEARSPGVAGNGIRIVVQRGDYGSAASVTVSGNTITVFADNNPNATAQQLVDAINSHGTARQMVTAAVVSGSPSEGGQGISASTTLNGGSDGTTFGPLLGYVTGLAFGDFHGDSSLLSNAERLYGVTSAGELIRINTANGAVDNIVDLTPLLPATATGFSGLALGPQNLYDGALATTLFAITDDGQILALNPGAFGAFATARTDNDAFDFVVNAFDSGNTVQELSFTGPAFTTNNFTLSFDPGTGIYQTTDLITSGAPTVNSLNEQQRLSVTATGGTFDLSFVNDHPAVTALTADVTPGTSALTVQDAADFPLTNFLVQIESELVRVTSRAGNTLNLATPLTTAHDVTDSVVEVKSTSVAVGAAPGSNTITVGDAFALRNATRIRVNTEILDVASIDTNTNVVTLSAPTVLNHSIGQTVNRIETATISYGAGAAAVQTALAGLPSIAGGDVVVTSTTANVYDIEFTGSLRSSNLQPLIANSTNLVRNEIQDIVLDRTPNQGTFTITVPANSLGAASVTAAIPWNATALDVENALEALGNVNDVTVTSLGAFGNFRIEFVDPGSANLNLITVDPTGLAGLPNEVETLQFTGVVQGGNFFLNISDGVSSALTTSIPYNAGAAQLQAAIESIGFINPGDVRVTGSGTLNSNNPFTITFLGGLSQTDIVVSAFNFLSGISPGISLTETIKGGGVVGTDETALAISEAVETTVTNGGTPTAAVATVQNGIISIEDALESLPGITDVVITGGNLPGIPVQIVFSGTLAATDVLPLTANNSIMQFGQQAVITLLQAADDGIADTFIQETSFSNPTGLAFSPLDFNLWHPTTNRGTDTGHGINTAFDNSRTPSDVEADVSNDNFGRDFFQNNGAASLYFGIEQFVPTGTPAYLSYYTGAGQGRSQYGILLNDVQRDLTSGSIGDTATGSGDYDLPGGAYGSLITNPFDLVSQTPDGADIGDRPTLYFNYFLQTEDRNTTDADGTMRDSARVYVSNDGGNTWDLLATNNTPNAGTGVVSTNATTEVPDFVSHLRSADLSNTKQQVQPLFDAADWRQARVDLSDYAGQTGLMLRFDFSTAGTIVDLVSANGEDNFAFSPNSDNPTNDPDLQTPQDEYGNLNDIRRGQNNNFEGFYIDDIIIGWAERGEMITGATTNTSFFTVPQDPDPLKPLESLSGPYQVEVRRGQEFGRTLDPIKPEIQVSATFDPNVRFAPGQDIGLTAATDNFETGDFSRLGWRAFDGDVPWSVVDGSGVGETFFAEAANLGAASTAELTSLVNTGAGLMSFDLWFSPESGFDRFEVYLDGTGEDGPIYQTTAADAGFRTVQIPLTAGLHSLTFAYYKDGGGTDNVGFVRIDNVVFPAPGNSDTRGDRNLEREQGHLQIEGNIIRDSSQDGIHIEAGPRAGSTGFATPGSPINFETLNAQRQAPGVAVVNNVVARFGSDGISFAGDSVSAGSSPAAAVPFGKIVNNTIYAGPNANTNGTTGIRVENNAAPTLLNNLIVNAATGISVTDSSVLGAAKTVVTRTYFRGNGTNATGVTPSLTIPDNAANLLFVNEANDNFYLAGDTNNTDGVFDGALPIDRSLGKVDDRTSFVAVKSDLGIPVSNVISPKRDLYGQTRRDDPNQPPSGVGEEVFNDVGAIERADFLGPYATMFLPADNSNADLDPLEHDLTIIEDDFLTRLIVQLNDEGIGVDDDFVSADQWRLERNGKALSEGVDYTFIYNPVSNQVIFQAVTVFATDSRYTITVTDRSSQSGIRDLAGNPLQSNRTNGEVRFEIILDSGVNDPPVNSHPGSLTTPEDTPLVLNTADGNAISVSDSDVYLGTNELTVTLFAEHGTLRLRSTLDTSVSGSDVTFPIGSLAIGQTLLIA